MGAGFFLVKPTAHGVFQGLRLFENLLEHEMFEDALVGIARLGFDLLNGRVDAHMVGVQHMPGLRPDHAHLVVLQIYDLLGIAQERCRIAGEKRFLLAHAEHQRTAQAGADDEIRLARADDCQTIGPLEHGQHLPDRLHQITSVVKGDKLSDDFGVGVAEKDHAIRLKLALEAL